MLAERKEAHSLSLIFIDIIIASLLFPGVAVFKEFTYQIIERGYMLRNPVCRNVHNVPFQS